MIHIDDVTQSMFIPFDLLKFEPNHMFAYVNGHASHINMMSYDVINTIDNKAEKWTTCKSMIRTFGDLLIKEKAKTLVIA